MKWRAIEKYQPREEGEGRIGAWQRGREGVSEEEAALRVHGAAARWDKDKILRMRNILLRGKQEPTETIAEEGSVTKTLPFKTAPTLTDVVVNFFFLVNFLSFLFSNTLTQFLAQPTTLWNLKK